MQRSQRSTHPEEVRAGAPGRGPRACWAQQIAEPADQSRALALITSYSSVKGAPRRLHSDVQRRKLQTRVIPRVLLTQGPSRRALPDRVLGTPRLADGWIHAVLEVLTLLTQRPRRHASIQRNTHGMACIFLVVVAASVAVAAAVGEATTCQPIFPRGSCKQVGITRVVEQGCKHAGARPRRGSRHTGGRKALGLVVGMT